MHAKLRSGSSLPLPRPGVDRPLRGNCHPLSCAPDNQVRCVFAPYQKPPSTVRNMRAVLKKASWGTRRIFRGIRCAEQAFPVQKRYSVHKTGSCGTRRIFKGPQNSRLHRLWTASCRTGRIFRGVPCQKQHLPHRTHLQCAKQPPLSLFVPAPSTISFVPLTRNLSPAAPSLAPSTALGTRNVPRSEVSRHKKRVTSKSIKTFWVYSLEMS